MMSEFTFRLAPQFGSIEAESLRAAAGLDQ
jgi:hypothetical protein